MGCVVRFVATRASRGLGVDWRGLGVVWRARVGGWVGFEGVRFVRFVCLSRVCPGSPRCLFTETVLFSVCSYKRSVSSTQSFNILAQRAGVA